MAGLMMSIKGIPSTYNKDLQESVEPMLAHVKTLKDSLLIAARVLATLTTFPEKMAAALTPDMLATDLAEYLVRKGASLSFSPPPALSCADGVCSGLGTDPRRLQGSRFAKRTTSPGGWWPWRSGRRCRWTG